MALDKLSRSDRAGERNRSEPPPDRPNQLPPRHLGDRLGLDLPGAGGLEQLEQPVLQWARKMQRLHFHLLAQLEQSPEF